MIAIKVDNLSINLSGSKVLSNLSFEIEEGTFVSVVGPNGGGKSTLLKAILGLIPFQEGDIRIFGKEIAEIGNDLIGYVPQLKTLERSFPAIPLELVASGVIGSWPMKMSKDLIEKSMIALDSVGAANYAKKQLSRLSGGELQRVYLARCLVRSPKILLLDEPNTGIDYASEKLGLSDSQVYVNISTYGNTSAASIPIAIDEAKQKGLLRAGDIVATVGFGAGLTYGTCIMKWVG